MRSTPLPRPRRAVAVETAELLAAELEDADPREVIRFAAEHLGDDLVLLASFADVVLLDLALSITPDLPVVFLDTGFHFAETLETARRAQVRYRLDLRFVRPALDATDLWANGTTACCAARKVDPMERALAGHRGWLSGLRRDDHPDRAATPVVERDRRGLLKFNPLAGWTDADVSAYAAERELIVHPLSFQGYESIGCWPCTEPGSGRDGRWGDEGRTECGIHA